MPKTHAKLHDLNSSIDHFKVNGLFDVETGIGFITHVGDASLDYNAETGIFTFFDRTLAALPRLAVDGSGGVVFTRDTAFTTNDLTGSDSGGGPNWLITNMGDGFFNGSLVVNGSISGTGVIDTLDELLDPLFAIADPNRYKAYQKSMHLFDDAAPGAVNAFFVDWATKQVFIGDITVPYNVTQYGNLAITGIMTLDAGASILDGISITHTAAGAVDIGNVNANWKVLQTGKGFFTFLEVNSDGSDEAINITHLGVLPAIDINNVAVGGIDIRNSGGAWQINTEGSAYFTIGANPGIHIVGGVGVLENGILIDNAGTAPSIVVNQTGGASEAVNIVNTGAITAALNIFNSSALYDIDGNAHNWWVEPTGDITTVANIFANTGRVETPEVRFAGAMLVNATAAGDIIHQTADGSAFFSLTALAPEVSPTPDGIISLGSAAHRWSNFYTMGAHIPYLYDVRLIQGDGANPLRIDSNTQLLELRTRGANISIIDSGISVLGNSLILDQIRRIRNFSGSDINIDFVSANDLVLSTTAGHGILPSVDNSLVLGVDATRFNQVWAHDLMGVSLIDSAHLGVYQTLLIKSGTAATATRLDLESGTGGIRCYLRGASTLHPWDNMTNDLGQVSARWQDLWMYGNIDSVFNLLGSVTADLNITSRNAHNIIMTSSGGNIYVVGANIMDTGNVVPIANDTDNLGSPLIEWLNVYARTVHGIGALMVESTDADLTLRTSGTTGNVIIGSNGTLSQTAGSFMTVSATAITQNATTGNYIINALLGTIDLNSGGTINLNSATDTIDLWGANLLNVGTVDGIDLSASFCQSGGIATGATAADFTIDCDQVATGIVTLRFGTTNAATMTYSPAGIGEWTFNKSLRINGDFTVTGTQTIIHTQTLDVEDNVITVNRGGAFPGSNRGGMEVDRGVVLDRAGLFFDNTIARWICGIGDEGDPMGPGALEEIVTTDLNQTLVNKTLTTPTIGSFINANHNHSNAANGGTVSHSVLTSIGTNTHAQIDTHIADATIHFTVGSIDHTLILNIGTNTHTQIDTHIANANIHFTEASINHLNILNRGTYTHAQLDAHLTPTGDGGALGASYNVHGVTGYVVGTTDSQNITNKTFDLTNTFINPEIRRVADSTGGFINAQHNHTDGDNGGLILESAITDGTILARLAGNESITGAWTFNNNVIFNYVGDFRNGEIWLETVNILPAGVIQEGRILWKGDTDELYMGTGTIWKKISSYHPYDYQTMQFGRALQVPNNADLFPTQSDYPKANITQQSKIRALSLSAENARTYRITVYKNGVATGTYLSVAAALKANVDGLDLDFNAGDELSVRITDMSPSTDKVKNPNVVVQLENVIAA